MKKPKKPASQRAEKVAEKTYEPADYKSSEETERGLAVTHEQVSDTLVEGSTDGKIDVVDENGELISHDGDDLG
ncbi:YozQ family protein [Bacillus marinisedimentorum]|uniref:YozQ family protein n=1 Tax=Bacillus marinisedimentorum TaxID=1821260 RepID=UPI000872048B|nr:YozQ family protein [Bacillus marinisedimentorum]